MESSWSTIWPNPHPLKTLRTSGCPRPSTIATRGSMCCCWETNPIALRPSPRMYIACYLENPNSPVQVPRLRARDRECQGRLESVREYPGLRHQHHKEEIIEEGGVDYQCGFHSEQQYSQKHKRKCSQGDREHRQPEGVQFKVQERMLLILLSFMSLLPILATKWYLWDYYCDYWLPLSTFYLLTNAH